MRNKSSMTVARDGEHLDDIMNRPFSSANINSASGLNFDHLDAMLAPIGIWQHAQGSIPHEKFGFSIDDEARGLIVALQHWHEGIQKPFSARLGKICFDFIVNAALDGPNLGLYHNFCDANGKWLDPIGSSDSFGRTVWGLGVAYRHDSPFAPRSKAEPLLRNSLQRTEELDYLRSKAFVILGLSASGVDNALLMKLANELAASYSGNCVDDWDWFEDQLTYCNARLPQAMFSAALAFPAVSAYANIGTSSLDFLLRVSKTSQGTYAPIGNAPMSSDGWFKRGQERPPLFDQQPVDAGALVECCCLAYQVTGLARFKQAALDAFSWYLGNNIHGIAVYKADNGGVSDAINGRGISQNQGAESVLSFHLAVQALNTII